MVPQTTVRAYRYSGSKMPVLTTTVLLSEARGLRRSYFERDRFK